MIKRLLIVIPALNEQSTITPIIQNSICFGDILVIDDGSTDKTRNFAKAEGAFVISNLKVRGYEYSLNVGYFHAISNNYDAMITIDADGQLPTKRIPDFINALESGANLVVGKRKKLMRICERILSFWSKRLIGITDPYCGMKGYDLRLIINKKKFSKYNSIGTSLAFDYVDYNARVVNIEIETNKRNGKSRFGGIIKSEFNLFLSMLVGLYRLLKIYKKKN